MVRAKLPVDLEASWFQGTGEEVQVESPSPAFTAAPPAPAKSTTPGRARRLDGVEAGKDSCPVRKPLGTASSSLVKVTDTLPGRLAGGWGGAGAAH